MRRVICCFAIVICTACTLHPQSTSASADTALYNYESDAQGGYEPLAESNYEKQKAENDKLKKINEEMKGDKKQKHIIIVVSRILIALLVIAAIIFLIIKLRKKK